MSKLKDGLFVALFVSGVAGMTAASATVYDFSFTNTTGTASGTVSGEIFGLQDNATSAATRVVITSMPSGLNNALPLPIDATALADQAYNSFTVVNGVVTAADFWAYQPNTYGQYGYQLYIDGYPGYGYNYLTFDGDSTFVQGDFGLAAANIEPAGGAPEPSAWTLMLIGFAGLGALLRSQIRRAVETANT